ncbi:MAG: glycoside hydrolase family 38, partial [Candidatus Sumerlaeia bacterium]|nr:glycoside hydrolase family 38 [Candidatus Sumerlaeia bacterium]
VHFVQSSHWDREWFMTFQDYRHRLVGIMDRLLDRIASGELHGPFTADGQTILLEDYLDVRTDRREELLEAIRNGSIVAGPWYVLPDQFLVSAESLIRNIRTGRDIVRSYGAEPSNAGFVGDIFGHISQLPQIFTLFGMDFVYLWRGTNLTNVRHFIWEGADGTEVVAYRFGPFGYGDFAHAVRHADEPNHAIDPSTTRDDLVAFLDKEAKYTTVDPILLFDGWDHLEPEYELHKILESTIQGGDFELVFGTFDEYAKEVRAQRDRIGDRLVGELREPGSNPNEVDTQWLIPGVLSSRVPLKLENHECETLLCHWAEPFQCFARNLSPIAREEEFLAVAWRHLLQNHPHDSLCGCSIDAVHRDMLFRFAQSRRISERVATESLRAIAASVDMEIPDGGLRAVIFNSMPHERKGVLELELELPTDWPHFEEFYRFEAKSGFRIHDEKGRDVPYQRLRQRTSRQKFRSRPKKLAEGYRTFGVMVALDLELPPLGYTALSIKPEKLDTPTRHPVGQGSIARDHNWLENEHLLVRVAPNGTISLIDKATGRVYTDLLGLEDSADIGDGWYHGLAQNDEIYYSTSCHSDISIIQDGGELATIRIRTRMLIPENFDFKELVRSEITIPFVVENHLTLRKNQKFLAVKTIIRNTATDHRLRMSFPTDLKTDHYWTDSICDAVKRQVQLREDNHLLRELEVETKPQRSWIATSDGEAGLAVVSNGILESTVRDLCRRPIAVTLLRSTRKTVYTDGEPDGLLLGETIEYRSRLVPIKGLPDFSELTLHGQELAAGFRMVSLTKTDEGLYKTAHVLPATHGFLSVAAPVVMMSYRVVHHMAELRVFNPMETEVTTRIDFKFPVPLGVNPAVLTPVDLDSNPSGEPITESNGCFQITMKPKQIMTFSHDLT